MSETSVFDKYPDVSFIDNATLKETTEKCVSWYKEHYMNVTGEDISLENGEQVKLLLDTMAYMHFQKLVYLDNLGKMNLLKYATGAFLDNLGANVSQPPRDIGKKAIVTMRVVLSKIQNTDYIVPAGTLFATADDTFFESVRELVIASGKQEGEVLCRCTEAGSEGNGYAPGDINSLVSALPYVQEVINITESSGGEEEQSDEDYAESVYLAASKYNTTGNEDAYKYVIRQVNSQIGDIIIVNPSALQVVITFLMKDGSIPSDELLQEVTYEVKNKFKKSLNDYVTVKAPAEVSYDIDMVYWINESDRKNAAEIQQKVSEAKDKYKRWQAEKLSRDINPDMLHHFVMGAGVKRAVVNQPQYTVMNDSCVSICSSENVVYGGLEDD